MKVRFFLSLGFLMLLEISLFSQNWIRTYESVEHAEGRACTESYDKGFLFSGFVHIDEPTYVSYGWIQKTDVNGYELWRKTIKDSTKLTGLFNMRSLEDGGFIAIGSSTQSDIYHDPLVIKFNVCGDKEWCKLYNSPGNFDYGMDIEPIPEGGYMALMNYWGYDKSKRIWLFKLDDFGDIIWQQAYTLDTLFYNEDARGLHMDMDTTFIITGDTYWPDSIPPNYYFHTPLLIRVKENGNTDWELAWGDSNEFVGPGLQSVSSKRNEIFTASKQSRYSYPYGTAPTVLKTSSNGYPLGFYDIMDSTDGATSSTIDWFQDSCLAVGSSWKLLGTGQPINLGVFKIDTNGNFIKEKVLMTIIDETPDDACVTEDNKLFLIANYFNTSLWKWQVYAFKLNSDLEYDSIYNTLFTYDSLCPNPIVSDTVPLNDCEVIVNVNDPVKNPEKSQLHVFPNPAQGHVTIELPEYLIKKSDASEITITTYYHQWSESQLEVYDLFGYKIYNKEILHQEKKIVLDLSTWPRGMYIARLVFLNDVVGRVQFIVN